MEECETCRLGARKHQKAQCAHPAVVHMHGGQWSPPKPSSAHITSVNPKSAQPLFFLFLHPLFFLAFSSSSFTHNPHLVLFISFRFPRLPLPTPLYFRSHDTVVVIHEPANDYTYALLMIIPAPNIATLLRPLRLPSTFSRSYYDLRSLFKSAVQARHFI